MDHKQRVQEVMGAMSQGRVATRPDGRGRHMAVDGRQPVVPDFQGKQLVLDRLFGGATETLGPSSSIEVRHVHADGDCVVVEHSGRNEMPDGRRYDNNYGWVLRFQGALIEEVREYMDTQLVTETFGVDATR